MRRLLPFVVVTVALSPATAPASARLTEHLEDVRDDLAASEVLVLVPPHRPGGTTATVAEADSHFYRLLFTNDPEGALSHAEQVNVFVVGTEDVAEPPPRALPVEVRGTDGSFSCGASACVLDWRERGAAYSVGEFGSPEDAAAFAESLLPLENLVEGAIDDPAAAPAPDGGFPVAPTVAGVAAVVALAIGWIVLRRRRPAG